MLRGLFTLSVYNLWWIVCNLLGTRQSLIKVRRRFVEYSFGAMKQNLNENWFLTLKCCHKWLQSGGNHGSFREHFPPNPTTGKIAGLALMGVRVASPSLPYSNWLAQHTKKKWVIKLFYVCVQLALHQSCPRPLGQLRSYFLNAETNYHS